MCNGPQQGYQPPFQNFPLSAWIRPKMAPCKLISCGLKDTWKYGWMNTLKEENN